MWHDHPISQRNRTTERTVGVGVGSDRDIGDGGGLGENLKKGGRGVGNKGGLVPLCQLSETFKISHPPITKLTPHSWLPLISSKIFTSLHYSHF